MSQSSSNAIILIPARMGAGRLPGKPLADINGKPMIIHTWERAIKANIGPVVVACCEEEVAKIIEKAGGRAVMTDPQLPSGTDRVFAALQTIDPKKTHTIVINLQGDLPNIDIETIRKSITPLHNKEVDIGTAAAPITNNDEVMNPNVVKIAMIEQKDKNAPRQALYFSRAPIPTSAPTFYHHIGIYAFRRPALEKFVKLPPSPLELSERLEQLRAMEVGMRIDVALTTQVPISVDTPSDLERARAALV